MKILHLTPDFGYADGRSYYVSLLMKFLQKNDNEVFLFTNDNKAQGRTEGSYVKTFVFPFLSEKKSFLKSVSELKAFVKENNLDIIHSHHRYYELIANAASSGNKKVHTVFTALSLVDRRYFVEYKSEKIIAVSNTVRNMLVEKFKVRRSKIFLIPNFVDSNEEEDVSKHYESETRNSETTILSVGRFHPEKNFETLLNAVSLIKSHKIKLILIGEGEEESHYREIIKLKGLNAQIISPVDDLKPYFNKADICVLTSVKDPLPGFMLQSGLHRKPFIGSAVDGISELIKDKVNGLLFEKRNESELSAKIMTFIKDKQLGISCAENLHRIVKENYTEKTVVPEIENLYKSFYKKM